MQREWCVYSQLWKGMQNKRPKHPGGHLTKKSYSQVQPLIGPCHIARQFVPATIQGPRLPQKRADLPLVWPNSGIWTQRRRKQEGVSYRPGDSWAELLEKSVHPRQAEGSNPSQPACQPFKKKKEAKAHGIDWMWTRRIPPVFRPAITETSGGRRSQNGEKELPPSKPKKLQPGTERAHQTAWRREGGRGEGGREGKGRKSKLICLLFQRSLAYAGFCTQSR